MIITLNYITNIISINNAALKGRKHLAQGIALCIKETINPRSIRLFYYGIIPNSYLSTNSPLALNVNGQRQDTVSQQHIYYGHIHIGAMDIVA